MNVVENGDGFDGEGISLEFGAFPLQLLKTASGLEPEGFFTETQAIDFGEVLGDGAESVFIGELIRLLGLDDLWLGFGGALYKCFGQCDFCVSRGSGIDQFVRTVDLLIQVLVSPLDSCGDTFGSG